MPIHIGIVVCLASFLSVFVPQFSAFAVGYCHNHNSLTSFVLKTNSGRKRTGTIEISNVRPVLRLRRQTKANGWPKASFFPPPRLPAPFWLWLPETAHPPLRL